jgi:hypothetical protein
MQTGCVEVAIATFQGRKISTPVAGTNEHLYSSQISSNIKSNFLTSIIQLKFKNYGFETIKCN